MFCLKQSKNRPATQLKKPAPVNILFWNLLLHIGLQADKYTNLLPSDHSVGLISRIFSKSKDPFDVKVRHLKNQARKPKKMHRPNAHCRNFWVVSMHGSDRAPNRVRFSIAIFVRLFGLSLNTLRKQQHKKIKATACWSRCLPKTRIPLACVLIFCACVFRCSCSFDTPKSFGLCMHVSLVKRKQYMCVLLIQRTGSNSLLVGNVNPAERTQQTCPNGETLQMYFYCSVPNLSFEIARQHFPPLVTATQHKKVAT